jgi:hypothetical protein
MTYSEDLLSRICEARTRASRFFNSTVFKEDLGWAYTSTHDIHKYPAGLLYGTWAGILGLCLLTENSAWEIEKKNWAVSKLSKYRNADGAFIPFELENSPTGKPLEYIKLHCTNYCLGAILELDPQYDFESPYMNRFLDGDFLRYWLEQRSLLRPWEEGNNLVNVTAYIALVNNGDHPQASARLSQLLEWHRKYQNPLTGGFDAFRSPSYKQRIEALAGAVHNFHLHLYLNEPYGYEDTIASWMTTFLLFGKLDACLSIDFVELAVRTLSACHDKQRLANALVYHVENLLSSQNPDGGWVENDNGSPSAFEGFVDREVSSCTYSTWFRLASLGMVAITLLGDDPNNWGFRKTLGMGYAPGHWPMVSKEIDIQKLSFQTIFSYHLETAPRKVRNNLLRVGGKIL